ncbi:MAG: T9SS type A sorting domain-containing protein, partial [Winogradskyella sp.]|nr:T9SS type A sorting domain-containing protein [Winogradskyella sp.]
IPNSVNVYIEDNATNTFTLLNSNDYQISLSTDLNSTGRFYLHFTENSLNSLEYELEELQIYANPVLQTIHINGLLTEKTNFELFDIQGRRLKHIYLNTHITSRNIDVSTLAIGVYIVKITNSIGKKTKKVIIK